MNHPGKTQFKDLSQSDGLQIRPTRRRGVVEGPRIVASIDMTLGRWRVPKAAHALHSRQNRTPARTMPTLFRSKFGVGPANLACRLKT